MQIDSNIAGARERLQRLKERVHPAMDAALDAEYWQARAREVAQATLEALGNSDEEHFVPMFTQTITARAIEDGFNLKMKGGSIAVEALDLADQKDYITSNLPLLRSIFLENKQEAKDIIAAWVQSGNKIRDGRDTHPDGTPKTDEEIAEGIFFILFHPERTWSRDLAAAELLRTDAEAGAIEGHKRLQDFAIEWAEAIGLPADTAKMWMKAVMAAWAQMLKVEVPRRFDALLRAT